jgi:hypothetical protein
LYSIPLTLSHGLVPPLLRATAPANPQHVPLACPPLTALAFFPHTIPPPPLLPLQCAAEQVESWVVKAVTAGLVDGKMNQSLRTVTFSRSVQREFTSVQWKQLAGKMGVWVGHVNDMLRAIGSTP